MQIPDDGFYRHERLARGALNAPDTVHMHFDLGGHRDVQRKLCEKLVRFGATPKESCIVEPAASHIVSFPVRIKDELASYGLLGLRLLDDLDVEPCSAQLERVIAYLPPDGKVQLADTDGLSAWTPITAGYAAAYPGTVEVHHSICFPKKSSAPPISLQELTARAQTLNAASWSMFAKSDMWCFRSSRPLKSNGDLAALLERDRAKLASLYKEVAPGLEIAITVEQIIASWSYPLQPSEENRNRISLKQMMGTSDRHRGSVPSFSSTR